MQRVLQLLGVQLRRTILGVGLLAPGTLVAPAALLAQTDFYNLDHGRPLRVEDAYTTKRWAFELQASPISLAQDESGAIRYTPSIELKHGLLSGLEVSVGVAMESVQDGAHSSTGLHEATASALLNLWVEGPRLPAAAVRLTGRMPGESEESASLEVGGILTRSLVGPVRVHLNGAAIVGEDREEDWWAGIALDYVLPFQHTILLAETWTASDGSDEQRVHSAAGFRLQLTPTLAMDGGLGRDWSGHGRRDWITTLGLTYEFGVRALMPGGS